MTTAISMMVFMMSLKNEKQLPQKQDEIAFAAVCILFDIFDNKLLNDIQYRIRPELPVAVVCTVNLV